MLAWNSPALVLHLSLAESKGPDPIELGDFLPCSDDLVDVDGLSERCSSDEVLPEAVETLKRHWILPEAVETLRYCRRLWLR